MKDGPVVLIDLMQLDGKIGESFVSVRSARFLSLDPGAPPFYSARDFSIYDSVRILDTCCVSKTFFRPVSFTRIYFSLTFLPRVAWDALFSSIVPKSDLMCDCFHYHEMDLVLTFRVRVFLRRSFYWHLLGELRSLMLSLGSIHLFAFSILEERCSKWSDKITHTCATLYACR